MSYYIYKLEIGDYFYYGASNQKNIERLHKHKSVCYNRRNADYNLKVYQKIRQLCPNPLHFYSFVHFERYHEHLTLELKRYMENHYLQKYKGNPHSLNVVNEIMMNISTPEFYRGKIPCIICGKLSMRTNMKRHQRSKKCKKIVS